MASPITAQQIVAVSLEPDAGGLREAPELELRRFTATAGTTTTIAATFILTGASNDAYVGRIVKCVGPETSQNYGLWREVRAFSNAADTLTVDALPATVVVGDQWEGYLSPQSIMAESAGGSTTIVTDPDLNEAAATYTDDYLVAIAGANTEGTQRQISSWSSGAATSAAWPVANVIGDLTHVMSFPRFKGPLQFERTQMDLPQEIQRGTFDRDPSVIGGMSWKVGATLDVKGSGIAAGDGVGGAKPIDSWRMLEAFLAPTRTLGSVIAVGSSVNSFAVAHGTMAARWPVGGVGLLNGAALWVTSQFDDGANPDLISHTPQSLRTPLATTDVAYGGYAFWPMMTGHRTLTFEEYDGIMRWIHYGGLPTFTLEDFARNKVPQFKFAYQGGPYFGVAKTTPTGFIAQQNTVRPTANTHAFLRLGASTRLAIHSGKIDWGMDLKVEEAGAHVPDGHLSVRIVGMRPIGTFVVGLDNASDRNSIRELERYQSGEIFAVTAQHDQRPGHTVSVYGHQTKWLNPKHGVRDSMREFEIQVEYLRSNVVGIGMIGLGFN